MKHYENQVKSEALSREGGPLVVAKVVHLPFRGSGWPLPELWEYSGLPSSGGRRAREPGGRELCQVSSRAARQTPRQEGEGGRHCFTQHMLLGGLLPSA